MAHSVYPQKNEAQEIVGYMRVFRGPNGKYIYKGGKIEEHEVISSDSQEVKDFWAARSKPPAPKPTVDGKIDALEKRIEALEKK